MISPSANPAHSLDGGILSLLLFVCQWRRASEHACWTYES
jgi:hypothetical protein